MAEVILVCLLVVVGAVSGVVWFLSIMATGLERSATGSSDGHSSIIFGLVTVICLGGAAAFIFT